MFFEFCFAFAGDSKSLFCLFAFEKQVLSHGEEILSCKLPQTIEFVVHKAFDSLNSQSAQARDKDSYLQGGTLIKVNTQRKRHTHTHTHTYISLYIYIYIYRERERERERESCY